MPRKNTIVLKKYVDIYDEKVAVAELYPGHLLEITSAGKVQKHSTAGGNHARLVATEDGLRGNNIDVAFAANDPVQVATFIPGEIAFMRLKNGENVAIGDFLESAGDGTLQKHVIDSTGDYFTNNLVGIAEEAVDMSGSDGVDPDGYIKVRFI